MDQIPTLKCSQCQSVNQETNNYCLNCGFLLKPSLIGVSQKCPFCNQIINNQDVFCPTCGKKIRQKPLTSSFWTQLGIYLFSALLPPLGLWPGFRYLRQTDKKLKRIGTIAIILTFISIIITGFLLIHLMNQVNTEVNKQIQNLMQF